MRTRGLALLFAVVALCAGADDIYGPDVLRSDGPAMVRVPTAALILNGRAGGSISVEVIATPLPIGGPKQRVALLATIDTATLPATETALDLVIYLLGEGDDVVSSTSQRLTFDPTPSAEKKGLKFLSSLEVPPGSYDLRVLASLPDAFGLVTQPLEVPQLVDATPFLLAPWLLEPLDDWQIVLPASGTLPPMRPITIDSAPSLPAAAPILEAGKQETLCVLARQPGTPPWKPVAQVRGPSGEDVAVPLVLTERRLAPWPDLELLLFSFRVPAVPSADYELRTVIERGDGRLVSPPLDVRITAEDASRVAEGPVEPDTDSKHRAGRVPPVRQIAETYRSALQRLAAGDASAIDAVRRLEEEISRANPRAVFRQLEKAQRNVAERLGAEALLPVVLLHTELIDVYRQRGAGPLAEHSLRVSRQLARNLAQHASSMADRVTAGALLTSLADYLLRLGRLSECERLFEEALAVDPANRIAPLGLAVSLERRGSYAAAVEVLEALLDQDPNHPEARLRLALQLDRLGDSATAEEILSSLALSSAPFQPGAHRWIVVIAAQEAARIRAGQGRFVAAALQLAELPSRIADPGLTVQQAYLRSRSGQSTEARELLLQWIREAAAPSPAPRERYNRWPDDASEAARRRLEEKARELLPDLAEALSSS